MNPYSKLAGIGCGCRQGGVGCACFPAIGNARGNPYARIAGIGSTARVYRIIPWTGLTGRVPTPEQLYDFAARAGFTVQVAVPLTPGTAAAWELREAGAPLFSEPGYLEAFRQRYLHSWSQLSGHVSAPPWEPTWQAPAAAATEPMCETIAGRVPCSTLPAPQPLTAIVNPGPALSPQPPAEPPTEQIYCPSYVEPVIASDGNEYSNSCEATKRGLTVVRKVNAQPAPTPIGITPYQPGPVEEPTHHYLVRVALSGQAIKTAALFKPGSTQCTASIPAYCTSTPDRWQELHRDDSLPAATQTVDVELWVRAGRLVDAALRDPQTGQRQQISVEGVGNAGSPVLGTGATVLVGLALLSMFARSRRT